MIVVNRRRYTSLWRNTVDQREGVRPLEGPSEDEKGTRYGVYGEAP